MGKLTEIYKQELLQSGFLEAEEAKNHFYKELMPDVAFVLNIIGENEWWCQIVYGFASTAFTKMKNNEDALKFYGVDSEAIAVRRRALITPGEDTAELRAEIAEMYAKYAQLGKDELLASAKELRKQFIAKFAAPLKQLGLRKKGNVWSLPSGRRVFDIQKSMYSDEYYFNLYSDLYGNICGFERLGIAGYKEPFDWQLIDEKVFDKFIEECVVKEIKIALGL